jgi:hypothetical protein
MRCAARLVAVASQTNHTAESVSTQVSPFEDLRRWFDEQPWEPATAARAIYN